MKIIKATERIDVERPVFLIVGQPGIGKTSLGYSAPKPLLLDFDHGAHRAINRQDTLQIDGWASFVELVESPETLAGYDTLIIDTVGRMLDDLSTQIQKDNPKHSAGGGVLSLQGWGALKGRFRSTLHRITKDLGKTVVLLAHATEEKDGDSRIFRADIQGGSYAEVMKSADFIGYLSMVGRDRVLDFSPTDRYVGKNPAGWAPFLVPSKEKAGSFMADLLAKGREALGKSSEESAKVAQVVIEWKELIGKVETADQATAMIAAIAAAKPAKALEPQIKTILLDRAKALGLTFNKTNKAFAAVAHAD